MAHCTSVSMPPTIQRFVDSNQPQSTTWLIVIQIIYSDQKYAVLSKLSHVFEIVLAKSSKANPDIIDEFLQDSHISQALNYMAASPHWHGAHKSTADNFIRSNYALSAIAEEE